MINNLHRTKCTGMHLYAFIIILSSITNFVSIYHKLRSSWHKSPQMHQRLRHPAGTKMTPMDPQGFKSASWVVALVACDPCSHPIVAQLSTYLVRDPGCQTVLFGDVMVGSEGFPLSDFILLQKDHESKHSAGPLIKATMKIPSQKLAGKRSVI